MTIEQVDARGLACPQPVIRTRRAIDKGGEVLTIVDNETSQKNVTRMAEKSGAIVEAERREDGIYLRIVAADETKPQAASGSREVPTDGPLVLVVPSELMGQGGDGELGEILIRGFFHTLGEVEPRPDVVIFFNSGVRLVVGSSPILEDLRGLIDQGVEILACGTCLDYYELKDQVAAGTISNMYSIAETMLSAGRLVYI